METKNFCIIKDGEGSYHYFLMDWDYSVPFFRWKLLVSKTKSKVYNKVTLTILGWLLNVLLYRILVVPLAIALPFVLYYKGAKNFFTNSVWVDNVKFFHYTNIVLLVVSLIVNLILWL